MQIDISSGDATWEDVRQLHEIVWSDAYMATRHWRDVVWEHAHLRVLVREADSPNVVSHVGIYVREILWDDRTVTVGGIGGVMTHPDRRAKGLASAAMVRAIDYFRTIAKADFALLFCEPHNFALYRSLGWHEFAGEVYVEQPSGRMRFDAMTPFVYDLTLAPHSGTIDLRGLPW